MGTIGVAFGLAIAAVAMLFLGLQVVAAIVRAPVDNGPKVEDARLSTEEPEKKASELPPLTTGLTAEDEVARDAWVTERVRTTNVQRDIVAVSKRFHRALWQASHIRGQLPVRVFKTEGSSPGCEIRGRFVEVPSAAQKPVWRLLGIERRVSCAEEDARRAWRQLCDFSLRTAHSKYARDWETAVDAYSQAVAQLEEPYNACIRSLHAAGLLNDKDLEHIRTRTGAQSTTEPSAFADLLARHDEVLAQWLAHTAEDIDLILKYPVLSSPSPKSFVADLVYALDTARFARDEAEASGDTTEYRKAVVDLEMAWEHALLKARQDSTSHLDEAGIKEIEQARGARAKLVHGGSTPAEEAAAKKKLAQVLESQFNPARVRKPLLELTESGPTSR